MYYEKHTLKYITWYSVPLAFLVSIFNTMLNAMCSLLSVGSHPSFLLIFETRMIMFMSAQNTT